MAAHRPEIVVAAPSHIWHIAANVRIDDRRELELLSCWPELALRISLRTSLAAWTGTVNGVPVCMFGISTGGFVGEGRPWMIGTEDLDRFGIIFLRRCRAQVEAMLALAPVLVNYVSAENVRAISWLRWLGFTIGEAVPWGPRRALFHRFELRR